MQFTLRTWLLLGFLAAITLTGATATVVGVWMIGSGVSQQAQEKARQDLNSARLVYAHRIERISARLLLLSRSRSLQDALGGGEPSALLAELEQARRREGLDFLDLTDPHGRVLLRSQNPKSASDSLANDPVVSQVIGRAEVASGTLLLSPEQLARESPALASAAVLPLTAPHPESGARELRDGLVMEAATTLRDPGGALRGILVGGVLLNGDHGTVDEIRDTVYSGGEHPGLPRGGGTLCLDDVRVASSIVLEDGTRPVGTRVDPAVKARVLQEGKSFVDRALIVNERHFTAYEPLRDPKGKTVGMLCLGIPERGVAAIRRSALFVFLAIAPLGALFAVMISMLVYRKLERPIRELVDAMQAYGQGDLARRVRPPAGVLEFAALGAGFNSMALALHERDVQLRYRTEEQLGKAERLAMIGRLAAGVAHEINNPLGGILLFSSILLGKAAPGAPERPGLERISNEAKRCQKIVQGLLDFARKREPKLEVQELSPVIEKTLALVKNQALFHDIQLETEFDPACPQVRVDAGQLQQVLLNLVVNAAEAMKGKGALRLQLRPVEEGAAVQLDVSDTGCGMAKEQLEQLFEPFFTTKEVGQGTGLGLSISRGIVENHGGTIWADSEVGVGTTFSVRIPAAERPPASTRGKSSPSSSTPPRSSPANGPPSSRTPSGSSQPSRGSA